jgi:four helix bundle protein
MFEHERLRVFWAVQRLLEELGRLRTKSAPGYARLWRHVFESAESAALNISEGSGDGRVGKRVNFLRIAGGSIAECRGGIQSLISEGGAKRRDSFKSMELCICIGRMLAKLADYWDAQNQDPAAV